MRAPAVAATVVLVMATAGWAQQPFPPSLRCDGLELGPAAPAYAPGSVITVSGRGSDGASALADMLAYWAPWTANLQSASSWTPIGLAPAGGGRWSGTFSAPPNAGEYIVALNVVGSTGLVCGGNPAFGGCEGGIALGGPQGWTAASRVPCFGCYRSFVVAPPPGAAADTQCTDFTISPAKAVYGRNEMLTLTVTGAASGTSLQTIAVYFAKADANLTRADAWLPLSGTFNPATSQWTATVNTSDLADAMWRRGPGDAGLRMGNGELVLAPNIAGASGNTCSSNPGYDLVACPMGIELGPSIPLSSSVPCRGCPRRIHIDEVQGTTPPIDVEAYWNRQPGVFWHYQGSRCVEGNANGVCDANEWHPFEARVEIEQRTNVCGVPTLPLRFLKSNVHGYWDPGAPYNLRFFVSDTGAAHRWPNTLGAYGWKAYQTTFSPLWGLGTLSTAPEWHSEITTNDYQHSFFAPYLISPVRATPGWQVHREDAIFGRASLPESSFCQRDTLASWRASRGHHGWLVQVLPIANYPYMGRSTTAVRLKYVEYQANSPSGRMCDAWVLREDYYLVQGVGLTEVRVNTYAPTSPGCPTVLTDDQLTQFDPGGSYMRVVGYFDGTAMALSAGSTQVSLGQVVPITLPNGYVGPVEQRETSHLRSGGASTALSTVAWIDGGTYLYSVPANANLASVGLELRAPVATTPSSFERLIDDAAPPWSQVLTLVVPTTDAGPSDAGVPDAGAGDAGAADAGLVDAGLSDGGEGDGGALDAGDTVIDAGSGGDASVDGGCGCAHADMGGLALAALLAALRRRRGARGGSRAVSVRHSREALTRPAARVALRITAT